MEDYISTDWVNSINIYVYTKKKNDRANFTLIITLSELLQTLIIFLLH